MGMSKDNSSDLDQQEVTEYDHCDGCGIQDSTVYHDGHGYNICGHGCDQYSVRGMSRDDFL